MIYFKNTSTVSNVTLRTTEGFVCVAPENAVCVKGKLLTKPHSLLEQIDEKEYNEIKKQTKQVNKDNASKNAGNKNKSNKTNKNKSTKATKEEVQQVEETEEVVEEAEPEATEVDSESLEVEEVENDLCNNDLELLKQAWFETEDLEEKENLQKEIKKLQEELDKNNK